MEVIKVIAAETVCNTTPQAYGSAKLVRLFNNTAGTVVITRALANTATIGTFSLVANGVIAAAKDYSDTLASSASILAVPVAFSN